MPPAGSRDRAPGQGVRGSKPPWSCLAERFLVLSYVWNGAKLLCLWAVLWSLMVAAVPTCVHVSWVLIFHPWFWGGMAPCPPTLDPPLPWAYKGSLDDVRRQELSLNLMKMLHRAQLMTGSVDSKQHRAVERDARLTDVYTLHTTGADLQPTRQQLSYKYKHSRRA